MIYDSSVLKDLLQLTFLVYGWGLSLERPTMISKCTLFFTHIATAAYTHLIGRVVICAGVKLFFQSVDGLTCHNLLTWRAIEYKISNIRELLGHKVDLNFIEKSPAVRLDKD